MEIEKSLRFGFTINTTYTDEDDIGFLKALIARTYSGRAYDQIRIQSMALSLVVAVAVVVVVIVVSVVMPVYHDGLVVAADVSTASAGGLFDRPTTQSYPTGKLSKLMAPSLILLFVAFHLLCRSPLLRCAWDQSHVQFR